MRISDWSSDVCSSDLLAFQHGAQPAHGGFDFGKLGHDAKSLMARLPAEQALAKGKSMDDAAEQVSFGYEQVSREEKTRSEEHTSELQSLMRSSYAVFCLKKKKKKQHAVHKLKR